MIHHWIPHYSRPGSSSIPQSILLGSYGLSLALGLVGLDDYLKALPVSLFLWINANWWPCPIPPILWILLQQNNDVCVCPWFLGGKWIDWTSSSRFPLAKGALLLVSIAPYSDTRRQRLCSSLMTHPFNSISISNESAPLRTSFECDHKQWNDIIPHCITRGKHSVGVPADASCPRCLVHNFVNSTTANSIPLQESGRIQYQTSWTAKIFRSRKCFSQCETHKLQYFIILQLFPTWDFLRTQNSLDVHLHNHCNCCKRQHWLTKCI